ncbi:MAG: tyrosine-type recombinase/integrase, partial [Nocardioidaceae bacterium]
AAVRRPRVPKPRTMVYTEAQADAILAAAARRTAGAADTMPTAPSVQEALEPPTPQAHLEAARVLRAELDHAVLATLRWSGLRASELCQLTLTDLRLPTPDLHGELHVYGKGSKHRHVPVSAPLAVVLEDYLHRTRPRLSAGRPTSDRLFVNPDSPTGALAPRALLDLCRRHGHAAGVAGPHHPLRWRHTFATHTLARGASLHSVSRLLGHSRVTTTERYLHLDTGDLAAALERAYPDR